MRYTQEILDLLSSSPRGIDIVVETLCELVPSWMKRRLKALSLASVDIDRMSGASASWRLFTAW